MGCNRELVVGSLGVKARLRCFPWKEKEEEKARKCENSSKVPRIEPRK